MLRKFTFFIFLISVLAINNLYSQFLSPVNPIANQVIPNTNIDFSWNMHPDATVYHITIASNNDLTAIIYEDDVVINNKNYTITGQDTCYWNIVAFNGLEPVMLSDTFMFVIFTPLTFPGIQVWLNGDDVEADGNNKVATWTDKSDNANSFAQDDDSKKPILITNGLNDLPALQFDGNDFLSGGDILDIGNASSWSLFVVGKSNASEGTFIAKSLAAGVPNRWALFYEGGSLTFLLSDQNGQAFPFAAALSQYHLTTIHANRTGQNLKYRIDGVLKTSNNSISSNTYNLDSPYRCLLGGYSNGSDNGEIYYLNGNISELIIYSSLSEDQSLFVENMLRYKYYPTLYKEPVSLGFDILIADNFCDTTLDAGIGFSDYLWSTGETTQTISVNQKGYYSVTATDSYGVTSSDIIYVSYPEIGYSFADTTICAGDEIVWETGLGSFYHEWNTGYNGGSALTIGGPYPEGNYRVTVYDLLGCWATSDIINVQVDNFPNQISLGADRDECYGTNIGLISPPTGIVSYLWNDGTTSSVIPATESGNYHVTVTNNRGCLGIDTVQISISGYAPVVDFDADTACLGEETHFTNLSTITPPFEISEWSWDFGDSETSSEENPVHTYDAPGGYMVQLYASTDAGCNNFIQKEILVLPNPEAAFSVNLGLHHCLNSDVSFVNEANDPEITSWHWDFGDGSESNEENPQHVFTTSGTFEVWQKVTNSNGCSDSTMLSLNVDTDFQLPEDFHCLTPASEAYFYNLNPLVIFSWTPSSNTLYYRIEISDDAGFENIIWSSDITDNSYSQAIADTGTYYWRVFAFNMCNDFNETDVDSFFVKRFSPADISFWIDASEKVSVSDNKVTAWQDKSQNDYMGLQANAILQPEYNVNDSLINNQASVQFENNYINFGSILPLDSIRDYYMFIKYDQFSNYGFVLSKGVNGEGAFAVNNDADLCMMRVYYDNVITTTEWCMPEDSFFLVNVRMTPMEKIEVYHNLFKVSEFPISVDLIGTNLFDLIIGNSQYGDYTFPMQGEIAEIIVFDTLLNYSGRMELMNYFRNKYAPPVNLGRDVIVTYNFCDTTISAEKPWFVDYSWSNGETSPSIILNSMQSGVYEVTVTDIFGMTSSDEIEVNFPIVNQGLQDTTICSGNSIQWQALENDGYTYQWYGNASVESYIDINQAGNYAYIVTDSLGCRFYSDTVSIAISYFATEASLGPNDTSLCIGNRIMLSTEIEEAASYHWSNGSSEPFITIEAAGEYSVTVTSIYGCVAEDTINVSIHGTAPHADFEVAGLCEKNLIVFSDMSEAMSGSLTQWEWSINGEIVSNNQDFTHVFDSAGNYLIGLIVENSDGCSNSFNEALLIHGLPVPDFSPDIACSGNLIVFTDNSISSEGVITSVWWNFDGTYNIEGTQVLHEFVDSGEIPVTITVENSIGCTDSLTLFVEVLPSPVAAFTSTPACEGDLVYFINQSTSPFPWEITNYNWLFGDGNSSAVSNPGYEYPEAGQYEVTLWVKALNGCSDTISEILTVNPLPVADFNIPEFCLNRSQQLTDNSSVESGNIESWEYEVFWIGTYNIPNPEVSFPNVGDYPVTLTVTTNAGCTDSETKTVSVYPLPTALFTSDVDWGAVPLEVAFSNQSIGAVDYEWRFGDTGQSDIAEPTHTFADSGVYHVELIAVSEHGCTDTMRSSINVIVPILDLVLLNLETQIENDYLITSVDIINAGTLPLTEIDLIIHMPQNRSYRETVSGIFNPGSVTQFTLATKIYLNSDIMPDYFCIEGVVTEYPEYADINPENQILCQSESENMIVSMPYPNPVNQILYLDIYKTNGNSFDIEIYNSLGSKVYSETISDLSVRNYRIIYNLSDYPPGLYNIVIKQSDNIFSRQFIKL